MKNNLFKFVLCFAVTISFITSSSYGLSTSIVTSEKELEPQWVKNAYIYPLQPSMPEWKKYTTDELRMTCFLPPETIKEMTTQELIVSVIYFPYFIDFWAFENIYHAKEIFKIKSNALEEMLERPNILNSLNDVFNSSWAKNKAKEKLPNLTNLEEVIAALTAIMIEENKEKQWDDFDNWLLKFTEWYVLNAQNPEDNILIYTLNKYFN